ncbi:MAG: DHA2 family efflux MFS transporter permease subunit [Candidatus Tyrphobacter sp.]
MASITSADRAHGTNRWLVTITVMLGLVMAIIDSTIVNVALPTIAGNLGATVDDAAWIATGYLLSAVIIMPLNGWLTAYFGRRNFYAACIAIFTVASFLCGTAHSIWQLVFYRIIQGIGGGALQPTAQALLFETFPPKERGAAMAVFGLGVMFGPAVGPLLGGYLVDNATWPLIFFINIPIGILAFFMTLSFIDAPKYLQRPKGGIDFVALGLLVAGLGSLQYVLERGQHDDWYSSPSILVLSMIAVVGIVGFLIKSLRDKHPLVDLRAFRFREYTIGNVLYAILGFGLFGSTLIMPLFFQNIAGMSAFETGWVLLPGAIATAVSMVIAGRILNRVDNRFMIAFGIVMFGVSSWMLSFLNQQTGYWDVFWPRVIQGLGMGFLFVPISTMMLAPVPREELAAASGVSNLIRQIGGSIGIAILTTMLARETAIAWSELAGGVTSTHGASVGTLTQIVAQQATIIAYNFDFRLVAISFFVLLPLVFFMRPSRVQQDAAAPAAE